MGRVCQVCYHPHRAWIEKRILEGWVKKEIYNEMKRKDMNPPPYKSILNHARKCMQIYMDQSLKSDRLRKEKIREEIKRDLNTAKGLRQNLELLNRMIDRVIAESDVDDKATREELSRLIHRVNETIELILRFSDKVGIIEEPESLEDKIIYCLRDFPSDLIVKFKQRWESHGDQTA